MKEICQYFLGIDPAKQWIPVRPAQHYSMGGIRTNAHGAAYGLQGLFACGEAACWDLHGFNRLGGNSVAETVVSGMIVGEAIADFCASPDGELLVSTALIKACLDKATAEFSSITDSHGIENAGKVGRPIASGKRRSDRDDGCDSGAGGVSTIEPMQFSTDPATCEIGRAHV